MSELKATTNAGTIDDPIPQELIWKDAQGKFYKVAGAGGSSSGADPRVGDLADLNTTDKTTVVAAINEVNLKQATGGAPDANDINKGVTKLSDAIDSDLNATDGVTAATPLAVKNVNSKIGDLNQLTTTAKNNLVAALNEVKANGGSGGVNYVTTPQITSPTEGATKVSTLTTIVGTQYENIFANDVRKNRVFEIAKTAGFDSDVVTINANADSATVQKSLDGNTQYYVRIKDVSQKDRESNWSPVVSFTTGDAIQANTPTITLKGYNDSPDDIGSGLTIEGSAFALSEVDQSDTHASTSWVITTNSRAPVWQSLNDQTNKTSIIVPRGTLQKGTAYTVTVTYHATKFADSAPAVKQFTTSTDFGTVQAPVVSVSGYPDKVYDTSVFSGGVFSNTREPDTHVDTELVIIRSADMQQMVSVSTSNDSITIQLDSGILEKSTQYKARMRYKGQNFGWSDWGELSFTTVNEFVKYNHIGVPGTKDFGVGLYPEDKDLPVIMDVTNSGIDWHPKLNALPNTKTSGHKQYGLYGFCNSSDYVGTSYLENVTWGVSGAFMKYIPKFYVARLFKDDNSNLNDEELKALLPYVEVSLEQMKEAQRRAPHNSLVVAPAESFTNEADANKHGFILPRAFIDGGVEKDGFFIANTKTIRTRSTSFGGIHLMLGWDDLANKRLAIETLARCDDTSGTNFTTYKNFVKLNGSVKSGDTTITMHANLCTTFMWAVLACLSLVQGQYATSTSDCAWYDPSLKINFPKGINNVNKDVNDTSVTIDVPMSNTEGSVFANNYAKTTHNGSDTGITHVNGWLMELTIAFKLHSKILKKSVTLNTINPTNVEDDSLYENIDLNSFTHDDSSRGSSWGDATNSSISWGTNDGARDLMCLFPKKNGHGGTVTIFGNDVSKWTNYSATNHCGGFWEDGANAGIFYRNMWGTASWAGSGSGVGFRMAIYPS